MSTTIQINEDTWRRLHNRKNPGDSFDDIITYLLDEQEAREEAADE